MSAAPAYGIVDHRHDVIVVGAGGAGPAGHAGACRGGPGHGLHHQGVPDPQPYGGGPGRHFRGAGQHGRGRLALSHVRHREGVGLARRPGRHPRTCAGRPPRPCMELEEFGLPFSPDRGRAESTSARSAGMSLGLRQGRPGPPDLRLCGRPDRPRHAPHVVWPAVPAPSTPRYFHRVLRPRPHHGRFRCDDAAGITAWCNMEDGTLHRISRQEHRPGHRRLRPLPTSPARPPTPAPGDGNAMVHARRPGQSRTCRVRPVPPHRHLRRRLSSSPRACRGEGGYPASTPRESGSWSGTPRQRQGSGQPRRRLAGP